MKRLIACLLLASAAPAAAVDVAVTIDDLPSAVWGAGLGDQQAVNQRLLAGLVRNRISASGYVNLAQADGPDHDLKMGMLEAWLDAGIPLHNHGRSHLSATSTPTDKYIADAEAGRQGLVDFLKPRSVAPLYYRHPFLHTGATPEARRAIDAWLKQSGSVVAPVTLEAADWLFADVYEAAVRGGRADEAQRVADAYLAFSDAHLGWQMEAARGLFGRDIAHVLLIHANRLNADHMDGLVAVLAKHGLNDVPLAQVLKDPAYQSRDPYIGPDGVGWLERWARGMGKTLPAASEPKIPGDIQAAYNKLQAGG